MLQTVLSQAAATLVDNESATGNMSRVEATRGSIYDVDALNEVCKDVAIAFAYASKFDAKRLSEALASSSLPSSAVVVTVNGVLCSRWEEVAPAIEDDAPECESSAVARFWRRKPTP